ncbi:MAG: sugar phosphate isomerase/epimerase [Clostridia bacterium]|nr:sugar phosphate isomerase/epimerase [Clostridia bacterium]
MQISIVHGPIRKAFGEETALKMIKNAGFTMIDYSFNTWEGEEYRLGENYKENCLATKKLMDNLGLTCYQTHAPFEFKYGKKIDESERTYRDIVRAIECSAILGAKIIVIHAIAVPFEVDFLQYNLEYYQSFLPYAEKYGVKIAVENLVNSVFWTPYKLCNFVEMLNSPYFCACVDVGHAAITGTPPESFISGMKKGVMQCVHLHDTDGKLDRHWIPYLGNHNWDNIIKALAEYGFDGDLEMEIIHSYDFLDKELYAAMLVYAKQVGNLLLKKFNQYKE